MKKWELICDQEQVNAREPPSTYLSKLRTYLDPTASKGHMSSKKQRKGLMDGNSTQVLRNLEISLRTNNIEWVREFLDERNEGLDVLIDYLRSVRSPYVKKFSCPLAGNVPLWKLAKQICLIKGSS